MQRKIKWHRVLLICGGLLLGLGLVYLVALLVTLRQIEIAWRPITYSKTVSFPEKGVNIHIDTRVGGLLGNHSYITFSGTMKDQVLRDSIVLPDPYAFYKKQGIDTLFVCLSRNETYEVLHRIGPIVVEIRGGPVNVVCFCLCEPPCTRKACRQPFFNNKQFASGSLDRPNPD